MDFKSNFKEMVLDHTVEFPAEDVVFGVGIEKPTGRSYFFLIFNRSGHVYRRFDKESLWETVNPEEAAVIRELTEATDAPYYLV